MLSTYEDGTPQEVYSYNDCGDTLNFLWKKFHKNGQLSFEGEYKNGRQEGYCKTWSESGHQTAYWEMLEGKEHGFIECWYDDGVKKKEVTLNRGVENGPLTEWDESGRKIVTGNYVNGMREGSWWFSDREGSWRIMDFINDTLSGPTHEHILDSTGLTIVLGQYESDKETGLWKWFDEDSILYQTVVYIRGEYNGEHIEYHPDGTIKSTVMMDEGYYEGEKKYYNEHGKLTKTELYINSELINTY